MNSSSRKPTHAALDQAEVKRAIEWCLGAGECVALVVADQNWMAGEGEAAMSDSNPDLRIGGSAVTHRAAMSPAGARCNRCPT